MDLIHKIEEVNRLSPEQKERMYELMCIHYSNNKRELFDRDLSEKDWVLMLQSNTNQEIVGFSTQKLFPFTFREKSVRVLFSGDTIIQKEHWGSMALSLLFGKLMIRILYEYKKDEIYWMLISKGLRTYKYLPAFFIDYYPCYDKETPSEMQELMHALAKYRFSESYIPETGIVKADQNAQYLKEEYHALARPSKEHELFFFEANPGYARGDELVCLTRLSLDNINPFIRRVLKKYL